MPSTAEPRSELASSSSPLPKAFDQVGQALQASAVTIGHALLQQATKGSVDVAGVQQVVGQFLHDVEGIDVEDHLGAVPW